MRPIKFLFSIIFLIALFVIYSKKLTYDSLVMQNIYLYDINNSNWDKDSLFINSINDNFPTLTNTTIPLKSIKGKYIAENIDLDEGINYMRKGIQDNPYLMFSEANMADAFLGQNLDSFVHYTKYAHKRLPNNPMIFVMYANVMKMENKLDSILDRFDIISKRVNDQQLYRIVLASLIGEKDSLYKTRGIEIAKEAVKKYPNQNEFPVFRDQILYGVDSYRLAIELNEYAINLYNEGDLFSAITLFDAALFNHPNSSIYFENLINSYFIAKNYKKLVEVYDEKSKDIIDINLKTKSRYYESLIYIDDNRACELIESIDKDLQLESTKKIKSKCLG